MQYKILKDDVVINTIVADEEFIKDYCNSNGYEYEVILENPEDIKVKVTEAQSNKISDCSSYCQQHIYGGEDVALSDGTVQHFSYDLADQANVSEMFYAVLSGATEYPYHADDEICRVYSREDIVRIYSTLSMYKTELVTYFNNLKAQIMQMDDVDEINAVEFLVTSLESEFLENYNNMIATAKAQLETILSNIKTNG